MKKIITLIKEFFKKPTDDYLVNEIILTDLGYSLFNVHRYYKYLMIFKIPILVNQTDSLKVGNKVFATWSIQGSKNVKHRKYIK